MASAHDLAEIARSASEASKIRLLDVDLTRYQTPTADTSYPLEYVFYLLGDVQDKLVVDLGCGSGEEVVPLRKRGARVIGIDISPHLIAVGRERLRKYGVDAELRVGSAYETHLLDESVDVVFCMSILHHLQLDRVKNEIRRILKPHGLFIFKEPIRFSWTMKQLRRLFPSAEDVSEFEYPLNSKQLNALVDGFQVLASRSFRTPFVPLLTRTIKVPYLQKGIWSRDAWVLRQFPVLAHFATVRVMALRPTISSVASATKHDQSAGESAAVA
ncbi:MAG TPA: class I SAM-dependent methyltransferase [Candidatus Sulfotelmatobacter sp.]|jgi:SAM-dependent methyltransferase